MKGIFPDPFSHEGIWLKGNLHTHSTFSDGWLTPRQLARLYKSRNYDFLAITDHWRVVPPSEYEGEDILVLQGEELAVYRAELGDLFHVVVVGVDEELPFKREEKLDVPPQDVIDAAISLGAVAFIAHPYWSMLTLKDLITLNNFLGIEVYNTTCDLSIGKGLSSVHWDMLLTSNRKVYGLAVDDAHWHISNIRPPDTCVSWVMVKAVEKTKDAVIEALKKGLFYSSTGPMIKRILVEDDCIKVWSSKCKSIKFIADIWRGSRVSARPNEYIEYAEYRLRGDEKYVRIECEGIDGSMAWSNPIFFV